jgi:hypothetical protein
MLMPWFLEGYLSLAKLVSEGLSQYRSCQDMSVVAVGAVKCTNIEARRSSNNTDQRHFGAAF